MDINNHSNISSQIANSISKLNLSTAQRAFSASKTQQNEETIPFEEVIQEDRKLIEGTEKKNISKSPIDVNDVQKYANSIGENLTIEDINYGLMYGRSVIADFCV